MLYLHRRASRSLPTFEQPGVTGVCKKENERSRRWTENEIHLQAPGTPNRTESRTRASETAAMRRVSLTSFLSSKEIFDIHLVAGFVFEQRLIGQSRSFLTVNENVSHRRGPRLVRSSLP